MILADMVPLDDNPRNTIPVVAVKNDSEIQTCTDAKSEIHQGKKAEEPIEDNKPSLPSSEENGKKTLVSGEIVSVQDDRRKIEKKCSKLNKVFKDHGIRVEPIEVDKVQEAARFTRFTIKLKSGETERNLGKYKNDIEIQLEANGEILIDHIKGTGYMSVDVPFADSCKTISLIDKLHLLDSSSSRLDVIAGQMPDGKYEILDVAGTPHMLVAGTTGSGKTIFVSLLYQYTADDLELLIVDPKETDFIFFEGLSHLYGGKSDY